MIDKIDRLIRVTNSWKTTNTSITQERARLFSFQVPLAEWRKGRDGAWLALRAFIIGTHRKEDAWKAFAVPQAEERLRASRVLCRERYWSLMMD